MRASSTSSERGAEIRAALRFLTVFPVGAGAAAPSFGSAAFAIVGFLLGLALLAVDALLGVLGSPLVDLALVAFAILATGAIHMDGLADSCDGLGGRSREESLRLMAEGSIGTFAVLGLMLAFAARIGALVSLGPEEGRAAALFTTPAIGRVAMLLVAADMPAARPGGLGAAFADSIERSALLRSVVAVVAITVLLGGFAGFLALAVAGAAVLLVRVLAVRRIGGVTGDVVGAAGEIAEVLALVAFAAWGAW